MAGLNLDLNVLRTLVTAQELAALIARPIKSAVRSPRSVSKFGASRSSWAKRFIARADGA
jgi:hypothetical protein